MAVVVMVVVVVVAVAVKGKAEVVAAHGHTLPSNVASLPPFSSPSSSYYYYYYYYYFIITDKEPKVSESATKNIYIFIFRR